MASTVTFMACNFRRFRHCLLYLFCVGVDSPARNLRCNLINCQLISEGNIFTRKILFSLLNVQFSQICKVQEQYFLFGNV